MAAYDVYLESLFVFKMDGDSDFDRDTYFALETKDKTYANPSTFLLDTIHDSIMTMWGFPRSSKPNYWERDMLTDKIKAMIAGPNTKSYSRKKSPGKEEIEKYFKNPEYIFQSDAFVYNAGNNTATLIGFSGLIDQAGASCEKWLKYNGLMRGITIDGNSSKRVDKILEMGGMCCYRSVMNLSNPKGPKSHPDAPDTLAYTAYLECDMLLFYYFYNRGIEAQGGDAAAIEAFVTMPSMPKQNDGNPFASATGYEEFINDYRAECAVNAASPHGREENKRRLEKIHLFVLNSLWACSCAFLLQSITKDQEIASEVHGNLSEIREAATEAVNVLRKLRFNRIQYPGNGGEPILMCGIYDSERGDFGAFEYSTSQGVLSYFGETYMNAYNPNYGYITPRGKGGRKAVEKLIAGKGATKAVMIHDNINAYVNNIMEPRKANGVMAIITSFLKFNGDSFHLLTWNITNEALKYAGFVNGNGVPVNMQYILCQEGPFTARLIQAGANGIINSKLTEIQGLQAGNKVIQANEFVIVGADPNREQREYEQFLKEKVGQFIRQFGDSFESIPGDLNPFVELNPEDDVTVYNLVEGGYIHLVTGNKELTPDMWAESKPFYENISYKLISDFLDMTEILSEINGFIDSKNKLSIKKYIPSGLPPISQETFIDWLENKLNLDKNDKYMELLSRIDKLFSIYNNVSDDVKRTIALYNTLVTNYIAPILYTFLSVSRDRSNVSVGDMFIMFNEINNTTIDEAGNTQINYIVQRLINELNDLKDKEGEVKRKYDLNNKLTFIEMLRKVTPNMLNFISDAPREGGNMQGGMFHPSAAAPAANESGFRGFFQEQQLHHDDYHDNEHEDNDMGRGATEDDIEDEVLQYFNEIVQNNTDFNDALEMLNSRIRAETKLQLLTALNYHCLVYENIDDGEILEQFKLFINRIDDKTLHEILGGSYEENSRAAGIPFAKLEVPLNQHRWNENLISSFVELSKMGLEPYIIFNFILRVFDYYYSTALYQFINIYLLITGYNGELKYGDPLWPEDTAMLDTILISAVEEQTKMIYPDHDLFDFINFDGIVYRTARSTVNPAMNGVYVFDERYNLGHLDSIQQHLRGGKPSKKQRRKTKKTKKHKRKQNKKGKAKTLRLPRKQVKKTKRKIPKKQTKRKGKKGKKN